MKINFNTAAIRASKELNSNDKRLSSSVEKLTSGYKINQPKDNPSGLAISKKMSLQIKGLTSASENASNGISVIETAEGALAEVQEMVQRMNELAVKGSTGSITDADRTAIQAEVTQLKNEINRIVDATEFNGKAILNGDYDIKGYTSTADVKVSYYSDEVNPGQYTIPEIVVARDADGNLTGATTVTLDTSATPPKKSFPAGCHFTFDKDTITIKGIDSFELKIEISDSVANGTTMAGFNLDLTGIGAMRLQIGSNEGQTLEARIPKVSLKAMGIEDVDFSTEQSTKEALDKMDEAVAFVSGVRSRLGAYQNRLEHTVSSLDVTNENMNSAYSRLMDVDMAAEMTEYTKNQVLVQAGTSMLAQANERPAQLLQLLQ